MSIGIPPTTVLFMAIIGCALIALMVHVLAEREVHRRVEEATPDEEFELPEIQWPPRKAYPYDWERD